MSGDGGSYSARNIDLVYWNSLLATHAISLLYLCWQDAEFARALRFVRSEHTLQCLLLDTALLILHRRYLVDRLLHLVNRRAVIFQRQHGGVQ